MMGDKLYFVTVEGVVSDVYRITAANEVYASRDAQAKFCENHRADRAVTVLTNEIRATARLTGE
jgi:hypothetical protein